ncbi:sulfite exporter TauE/SafE family protein [Inquilinus sp. CAU 1745]|uniref:sulfite exporter TauE/SafE family protein n=1 Tax=Inquilinus sp. CAU 1745 TaxID=3140369 RepID=UPI00325BD3CB
MTTIALLMAAAFLAGALNAMAGGGSFLTLPALIHAGVPPVAANATGTVALLPGYVSGAYGFRRDLTPVASVGLPWLAAVSLAGGLVGALLLLVTPDDVFRAIVPWLLLAATALFAFGGKLSDAMRRRGAGGKGQMLAALFVVSVYGGYFNGGLGILLLAHLALFGMTSLNAMNGLKTALSAVLTTIAVAAYAVGGAVHWKEAAIMTVAAIAGGYAGARLARRIPPTALRIGIVALGLIMAAAFFAG